VWNGIPRHAGVCQPPAWPTGEAARVTADRAWCSKNVSPRLRQRRPSRVGKIVVGGIDLNKPRMRWVAEAVIALSAASDGFTASDLAARVRALGQQTLAQYGPTRAAYDLKKFRGQQIVQRIGATRRYEAGPAGLKAITALVVLRDKAIKPLLAAAQELRPRRGAHNPTPLDAHYDALRTAMRGVFHELGIAA
jgi:hypothetical protein